MYHFGVILWSFWDPKSFSKSDSDSVSFCNFFLLFSMDLLSSWISKNLKKPKENQCFSMIFINAFFPLDDELQAKQTREKHLKSSIFYWKYVEKSVKIAIEFDHRFLTPFGTYFGPFWEPLGTIWASWASIWAALSAHWSLFCPLLAHLGAILVPFCYTLGYFVPPGLILEPSKHHFGAFGD